MALDNRVDDYHSVKCRVDIMVEHEICNLIQNGS